MLWLPGHLYWWTSDWLNTNVQLEMVISTITLLNTIYKQTTESSWAKLLPTTAYTLQTTYWRQQQDRQTIDKPTNFAKNRPTDIWLKKDGLKHTNHVLQSSQPIASLLFQWKLFPERSDLKLFPQRFADVLVSYDRVQVHHGFAVCQGSETSPPLPTTTKHLRRFRVQNDTKVTFSATKGHRRNKAVWCKDILWMRKSLHWRNRKISAGKDQRAWQEYRTPPFPDLCRFWACQ